MKIILGMRKFPIAPVAIYDNGMLTTMFFLSITLWYLNSSLWKMDENDPLFFRGFT